MGRQRSAAPTPGADPAAEKTCAGCGRRIEWRARWARDWEHVRWCSGACRARGVRPVDRALEESIRSLLAALPPDGSLCPSEAARSVAGADVDAGADADDNDDDQRWRELREPARRAARRLVATGDVEIIQGGRVVDPSTAKGPIRVRRAR
jgi:hypothetical protein